MPRIVLNRRERGSLWGGGLRGTKKHPNSVKNNEKIKSHTKTKVSCFHSKSTIITIPLSLWLLVPTNWERISCLVGRYLAIAYVLCLCCVIRPNESKHRCFEWRASRSPSLSMRCVAFYEMHRFTHDALAIWTNSYSPLCHTDYTQSLFGICCKFVILYVWIGELAPRSLHTCESANAMASKQTCSELVALTHAMK